MTSVAPPRFDPSDRDFIQDPYPTLRAMREHAPVLFDDGLGLWLVTRHADVHAIQRDRRFGRVMGTHAEPDDFRPIRTASADIDTAPYYDVERHSLLMLEPPEHTRLRGLVSRAFTPRRVRELRPTVESIAASIADALPAEFDLLADFAQPYSVQVIAALLGAPTDDAAQLLEWSHAIVKMYELHTSDDEIRSAVRASAEFAEWTADLVARRKDQPADDLITALAMASTEDGTLTDDEIVSTVILLLNAGHEATVNTLGNGMTAIFDAGAWNDLTGGVVPPADAIEEMLRFDSPLQLFERWVLADDVDIAGVPIPRGEKVAMLFGAANRDPRRFSDPDDFLVGRADSSHITFGGGIHFCIGAPLARLELEVAVATLARQMPRLRSAATPKRIPAFVIRGYESVPVAK